MEATDPRVRSLLRQAKRTANVGKRAAARQLYEQILAEAPDTVEAWLGLARLSRDPAARRAAYERVLELDPENEVAQEGLEASEETFETPEAQPETAVSKVGPAEPVVPAQKDIDERTGPVSEARLQPARPAGTPEITTAVIEDVAQEGEEELLFCYRHPSRRTGLRCYSCNQPICIKCAKHTPVGYRCPQCIREAQDVFFTASLVDYAAALVVSLILSLIAGAFLPIVGFFVIFIAPAVGTLIGRIAFRAARRRHGRLLPHLVAAMVALGGLLPALSNLLLPLLVGQLGLAPLGLLWPLVYVFLATGTAFYQVR